MIRRAIKIFFALTLLFAAVFFSLPEPKGFPILEYHNVTNDTETFSLTYNVPPEEFSAQLDYLSQNGYTTITLQDFMRAAHGKGELPEKPIVLTFDDGYENNYTEMLPILEAHGMKAVVYVIANNIGKEGYLSFEQLRDMQKRGIEIGSHTADHIPLSTFDDDMVRYEIRDSKLLMEWNGLETIYSLSYPNGDYKKSYEKILREENYLTAVTGDAGLNNFETNPYFLQRVHVRNPHFGILEFKWRLFKAYFFAKFKRTN